MDSSSEVTSPAAQEGRGDTAFEVLEPTVLGKYTLIARLGSGGMGDVLLAIASSVVGAEKLVVIKRLHAHLTREAGLLDMFLDESRLATRLRHPNVVATHEVDHAGDTYFMAMEYLEGQSFDQVVKASADADAPLPIEVVVRIVADALEGMHYVHELSDYDGTPLDVVHRDISPQNIFVTYDGTVKLIDFGVAKAVPNVVKTQTGMIKGKFPYMAPEQAESDSDRVDRRTDVWAMGVVLFEALAGERPFKAGNAIQLLKQVLFKKVPRLEEVAPHVPRGIADVVNKALMRDPKERYPTAAAMALDLEAWLSAQERAVQRPEVRRVMGELFRETMDGHREQIRRAMAGRDAATVSSLENPRAPSDGLSRDSVETVPAARADGQASAPNLKSSPKTRPSNAPETDRERSLKRLLVVLLVLLALSLAWGSGLFSSLAADPIMTLPETDER